MTLMMKDDLCQKWMEKLIFQGTYRLLGTGIVDCLKNVDVGCNLKQFDVDRLKEMHFSFSAVRKPDENEIPFSAEKRSSPVPISHNLVTVQLRTYHFQPNAKKDTFGTKTKNKTKMKIYFRSKRIKLIVTKWSIFGAENENEFRSASSLMV